MAFKSFNWKVMQNLQLSREDVLGSFASAITVFGIQLAMIVFVGSIMVGDSIPFEIVLPNSVIIMTARFICSILMHL